MQSRSHRLTLPVEVDVFSKVSPESLCELLHFTHICEWLCAKQVAPWDHPAESLGHAARLQTQTLVINSTLESGSVPTPCGIIFQVCVASRLKAKAKMDPTIKQPQHKTPSGHWPNVGNQGDVGIERIWHVYICCESFGV